MKLQNAYDTIRDPEKRRAYDARWACIRDGIRAQQDSDRRQAEAAEAEKARTTRERAKIQKEYEARQERLRSLETLKSVYDNDIFEVKRVIRNLLAELKRLQDHDDAYLRKRKEQNSWWVYLSSPIFGKAKETDEQKQVLETERLHRLASKTIKRSELLEKQAKLRRLQDTLLDVNNKIDGEKEKADDEARTQAREKMVRMEQEARDRAQQKMRDFRAKMQKAQAERDAKEAREAQAAREAQEAQERVRKAAAAAAAEKSRKETEERAEARRAAEQAAQKARNEREKVLRMEQKARDRAQQEMREIRAKMQKAHAERDAKEAREAQAAREAQEAQEAQEHSRKTAAAAAAAVEKRRKKTKKRAEPRRKAPSDRSKPATPLYSSSHASRFTKSTCRHDKFWPKIEGKHLCTNCHAVQNRFAFQCPGCKMIACASCRQTLKGKDL